MRQIRGTTTGNLSVYVSFSWICKQRKRVSRFVTADDIWNRGSAPRRVRDVARRRKGGCRSIRQWCNRSLSDYVLSGFNRPVRDLLRKSDGVERFVLRETPQDR